MAQLPSAWDESPITKRMAGIEREGFVSPVPLNGAIPPHETGSLGSRLADLHCPLAAEIVGRERFESLLAHLSTTFVFILPEDVDAGIRNALALLVDFMGVDRGSFGQYRADLRSFVVTHSYAKPGIPPMPEMILDDALPWYTSMIRRGELLRLCNLPADLPGNAEEERKYCVNEGLKSHVMIPLRVEYAINGVIGFGDFHGPRDWPEGTVRRLRIVGDVFANAVARKRVSEELRDREGTIRLGRDKLRELASKLLKAHEDERARIAREMHDDWSQRLAVMGIELTLLEKHIGDSPAATEMVRKIRADMVDMSGDVHDLSRQLHPSILEDLGLCAALRSEANHFEVREGIAVHIRGEAPPGLSKEIQLCVYRVVQEALRNVVKHAHARTICVALESREGGLHVEVKDDGIGFDMSACRSKHGIGITSMSERLRLIGAELSIESNPGRGARLSTCVPFSGGVG